jgi:hypothetical protein
MSAFIPQRKPAISRNRAGRARSFTAAQRFGRATIMPSLPAPWAEVGVRDGNREYRNTLSGERTTRRPAPLPKQWRLAKDAASGTLFYWHVETRAVKPYRDWTADWQPRDEPSASSDSTSKLPYGWTAWAPSSADKRRFVNNLTGEVTWRHPDALPRYWRQTRDLATGTVYYWNTATKEVKEYRDWYTDWAPAVAAAPPPNVASKENAPPAYSSVAAPEQPATYTHKAPWSRCSSRSRERADEWLPEKLLTAHV